MASRKKVIEISRSWIGTPYHHQESLKGEGCDCLGLLRGVWRELYGDENPEPVPSYSPSWGDHRVDDPLMVVARKYFTEQREPRKGDILLFRMRPGIAVKHCSIFTGEGTMIHAYSNHQVREDTYSDWWKKKQVGVFKFKGVR